MSEFGDNTDQSVEATEVVEVEVIPEVDAPADGGQADAEVVTPQETDVFNVDEYGDRLVAVKVNGEEVQVPLKEALGGYQRQADYTRKTQELSRAQAMMEALENNPQAALQFLSQQYGGQATQQAQEVPEFNDGFDDDDPVAQTVRSMRSELEELRSYQTEQVLDRTISGLKDRYGDDFDEAEVIKAAAAAQITHPAELEGVFRDLMFDKFYATAKTREGAASTAEAERAAREQAKQQLAQTVVSGNGASAGSAGSAPTSFDSLEDAFEAAKASLGVTF